MTVQRILDAKGKGAAHIAPDATIADFLQSLKSQNADALVVSNDGSRVDGIISEHDVVRGLREFGSDLLRKPVRELMTAKVITCTPGRGERCGSHGLQACATFACCDGQQAGRHRQYPRLASF